VKTQFLQARPGLKREKAFRNRVWDVFRIQKCCFLSKLLAALAARGLQTGRSWCVSANVQAVVDVSPISCGRTKKFFPQMPYLYKIIGYGYGYNRVRLRWVSSGEKVG
jgi:hypothetical protein